MANRAGDKTAWDKASEGIHRGTMKGAVLGAQEWPDGRLDSVEIVWGSRPKYLPDGTVETDSDEPNVPPVTVTTRYVWQEPPPKLPDTRQ